MEFKNCIIHLIGFAGVGKLTIAKEIVAQSNFKLVDNHLINNPIFSVVEADGLTPLPKTVWEKTRIIRETVFDAILNISPPHFNFVLTNELVEDREGDLVIYKKVEELAHKRGSLFLPIRLVCDEEELCKRVVSEDRKLGFKEIDVDAAHQKSQTFEVLNPNHPNVFTLDVTSLSADNAAVIILDKMKALLKVKNV